MGGTIWVLSRYKHGSTFKFKVPTKYTILEAFPEDPSREETDVVATHRSPQRIY